MMLLWGDLISLDYVSLSSNLTDEEEYPISYRLISCYRWWIKYYKSLQLTDYCYSTERIDTRISWYSAKTQTRKKAYYIFISSFCYLLLYRKFPLFAFFLVLYYLHHLMRILLFYASITSSDHSIESISMIELSFY